MPPCEEPFENAIYISSQGEHPDTFKTIVESLELMHDNSPSSILVHNLGGIQDNLGIDL